MYKSNWHTPWHDILIELEEELESITLENQCSDVIGSGDNLKKYPWKSKAVRTLQNKLVMSLLRESHLRNDLDIWPDEHDSSSYRFGHKRHQIFLTATIIVKNKNTGKYLLIKRKHNPFVGKMAFPGGFVDKNEDAVTAAQRELKEETSIEKDIDDFMFVDLRSGPNRDPRGHVVDTGWFVEVDSEYKKAGDDAEEADWYTEEEIDKMIEENLFSFDLEELWISLKEKEFYFE